MKMLVSEFLQAYDLRGALLEKAKKKSNELELTVSLSDWQGGSATDSPGKNFLILTFLNIFELEPEIPLHKIKGHPLQGITAEQLPTVHGVTEQLIRVGVEAADGIRTIKFQSRRMGVEEAN
ncbi:MAG: hypothetical protein WCP73_10405, partial [Eubacteriales bacterium]